jgi:carbonic anhydrase
MTALNKLISGYKSFYQRYYVEDDSVYRRLATEGQFPKVAMIACSDSRVDPSILMEAAPGEVFVIRNVANLVPPYQNDTSTYHGTSAALEFAVTGIGVEHVVILGHSKCAGIRALIERRSQPDDANSFVHSWMHIADAVKQEIREHHNEKPFDVQAHICERGAIALSVANLKTFPWIAKNLELGKLSIHGWHFDIDEGVLWELTDNGNWEKLA